MTDRNITLQVRIARDVFGWEWRDDWQAWCPPGWPPLSVINAPYLTKQQALERHGGIPSVYAGGVDERGRPLIPSYAYNPESTEILWKWLGEQPGIQSIAFFPVPPPAVPVLEAIRWRCVIQGPGERLATGEGNGHNEALCRAVLAWAEARR